MNNNNVLVIKKLVNFYIYLGKISRHKASIQCGHVDSCQNLCEKNKMVAKIDAKPYYYLQEMSELENRHPDVYLKFLNGRHVVRTNKFWAGLSSDLVIGQTLKKSLKTSGDLKHGSGMNEEQCSLWTMSMSVTAMYNMAM